MGTDSLVCAVIPISGTSTIFSTIDNVAEAPRVKRAFADPVGGHSRGVLHCVADLPYTAALINTNTPVETILENRNSTTATANFPTAW